MKRLPLACLLFATLMIAACPLAGSAQSADALFQQALRLERVQGDFSGAIGVYQRIVDEPAAGRVSVARALVQMGKAYESLGRTEAFSVYERVVRDFADLDEQAAEARNRMRGLAATEAPPPAEPTISFISTGYGPPSPDGRLLALIDADFSLAVYDLAKRSTRVLAAYIEEGQTVEAPENPIWSPDGRSVAYTWWIYNRADPGERAKELRIVDLASGSIRVLATEEDFSPNDWSPDRRFIIGKGPRPLEASQINVQSGSSQAVWTDTSGVGFSKVRYSPDGRYLGFARYGKDRSHTDIWVITADGSDEWAVIEHPAQDYGMYWSPNGNNLIFWSDRTGDLALWAVPVHNGRAAGDAYLLHPSPGPWTGLRGITRDGRLYFHRHLADKSIYTVEMDVDSGRMLSDPVKIAVKTVGVNEAPAWSPDGSKLAWGRRWSPGDDETHLVVREMATGIESEVVPKRGEDVPGPWTLHPSWSPDGTALYANILTWPNADFKQVDYATGDVEPVGIHAGASVPSFLDEGRLVYLRSDSVFVRNLATSTDRLLTADNEAHINQIKPNSDGSLVALLQREAESTSDKPTELWTIEVGTGNTRRIATLDGGRHFDPYSEMSWLAGDAAILVGLLDADDKVVLGRVDLDSGSVRVFDELQWPTRSGVGDYNLGPSIYGLHPDGKTVVFTIGYNRFEMWAIDNLIPD